ncbi:MAG: hypothetical protein D3910_26650 [Candidatus Electrothrix sp. ATG2]|nr:hypothetical protein [Candidatus Electrothrix sp. ATG2]
MHTLYRIYSRSTGERVLCSSDEDSADRVSMTAFFNALQSTPDYLPEEKAVFGLHRIGMKFRQNHQRAK